MDRIAVKSVQRRNECGKLRCGCGRLLIGGVSRILFNRWRARVCCLKEGGVLARVFRSGFRYLVGWMGIGPPRLAWPRVASPWRRRAPRNRKPAGTVGVLQTVPGSSGRPVLARASCASCARVSTGHALGWPEDPPGKRSSPLGGRNAFDMATLSLIGPTASSFGALEGKEEDSGSRSLW